MKPHPAIAALRDDKALHRRAQDRMIAAFDRWRDGAGEVLADLPRLALRGELGDAPALARLFAPGAGAQGWVAALVEAMIPALREAPLGHVPARHFTDGVRSTLLLGRSGPVTLGLAAVNGAGWARRPAPTTVTFASTRHWDAVVGGHAQAELIAPGERRPVALAPGVTIARDGREQALHLRRVEGCLVWLRLQWRDPAGAPACVHDLAGGGLLHQAAGSMRESRQMVMLSLLGRMGQAQAAPIMARMACEDGSQDLRWTALREALGLDTAAGFAALLAVAGKADDPLQAHAAALRDRLLARHPQLERLMPCPA